MCPFFFLQFVSALYMYQAKLSLLSKTECVMSLPAIQNVLSLFYSHLSYLMMYISSSSKTILANIIWSLVCQFIIFRVYLTLAEVVILILKHATILRLSNRPEEALILAGQDYQDANIDLKIQEHLKAFTPKDSVEKFADFIMATNIGLFIHSSIMTIFYLSLQPKQLHREDHY